jgi:hypothetical protein
MILGDDSPTVLSRPSQVLFIQEPRWADLKRTDDIKANASSNLRDSGREMLIKIEAHQRDVGLVKG